MIVIKRDGKEVNFDLEKIRLAIKKANSENELDDEKIDQLIQLIGDQCKKFGEKIEVEDIQDLVEKTLMKKKFFKTAKSYILYRDMRTRNRDNKSKLLKDIAKKINASNIVNQNANVDEASFGGRKGEASNELMKWFALNNCMSKKSKENHLNNEIYIHDLDSYAIGSHNCLSLPLDHLLEKGFNTRQTDIRPASSINTAFQLVAVLFQLQSLQQFGGVSATHLDWTMVPYVRKSFAKHYKDGLKYIFGKDEDDIDYEIDHMLKNIKDVSIYDPEFEAYSERSFKYAINLTTKELKQAVEGLYHNLNTLQSRSGNQLPFTSINYGTCTLPEGRMVIKALLEGSLAGVGKLHRTPIFPCGIFQMMKGVNRKPGDPNYDLFKLALKSTSLRLYPNYVNCDWSINEGYDKNDPKTYTSTMGAARGDELVSIRINGIDYIDIRIDEAFYKIKKAIQFEIGCNHLSVVGERPGKYKEICGVYKLIDTEKDLFYIGSSKNIGRRYIEHRSALRHKGTLGDNYFINDFNVTNLKLEILDECCIDELTKYESLYVKKFIGCKNCVNQKDPIKNGNFTAETRLKALNKQPYSNYQNRYSTWVKKVLDPNIQIKSGLLWVPIRSIIKNRPDCPLKLYEISYFDGHKANTLHITEDHPLATLRGRVRADELKCDDYIYSDDTENYYKIISVKISDEKCETFDFETDNDKFNLSGVLSHNCRTYNGSDINAESGTNPQTKDGRGNICPVTIILPTLAMEADRDVDKFLKLLDIKINEAKDMLIERFDYICNQSADSAKFMYENNIALGYKPEEGIRSALKHGTLALGQIGLAETLELLIGENQTTEKGMELAKTIEKMFKDKCYEFKHKYKLNFGVYYTPAENLCYTSMSKFKETYGEIPNVSDKSYFTNSTHVPVYCKINAFEKIDIESQLTGYSSAGCITYVELEGAIQNNLEALETLVNYAMDKDIPYFAVNIPNDTCLECGYTGEFNNKCPECGSEHIQQLRRVTGYLTGNYTTAFNKGKQDEVKDRVKHM